ncbi:MAG: glycosyltransferase family 2 protein [Proteobacteria bacterium]|nr:glycosyltransferase family 2 protein [Pseudomonadota bacterium]MBU4294854.1 glycosyltransferase family 2 protein [Pseudomonadota bacterium]MCG2749356.1 glycosyltransferase family 2 protein [Desulfobulbaceae bacterium]
MLVSIIIPSYNHQHYIAQSITSVLDQTWPEIDLIVVDDASTDNSPSIIAEILAKRGGFRFIHRQQNRGLISSLNEGLAMAEGQYFCELASDDFLPFDSIENRARFFVDHQDHVAIFADAFRVVGDTETCGCVLDDKRRFLFSQPDPLSLMLHGVRPIFATGMFQTDTLRKVGGFDPQYQCYEDLEMPVLLWLEGKVGFMDKPVLCRREHATNVSSTTSTIRTDKILCYEKLSRNPDLVSYASIIRYQLRRSYLALGRHLSLNGGGNAYERRIFQNAWGYALQDVRLLWHLIRWGKAKLT